MSPLRRLLFGIAAVVGGTLVGAAGAEFWTRSLDPRLPVQRIGKDDSSTLHGEGDGLYWTTNAARHDRRRTGCPSDATGPRVLLQGSSILWGSGVESQEAPGMQLRIAMQEVGIADPCVINHSQPGSTFATQRAALADTPAAPADVLVWELWQNSIHRFVRVGDLAYNFGRLRVGPGGVPDPFGMGIAARPLFQHSSFYAWMALRQAPRSSHERKVSDLWTSFAPTFVAGAMEQAERRGAQLLVASFPSLDRPFSEQLQWNREMYGPVLEALAAEGIPIIEMDRALLPHDPVDVRADTCCHYNPAGVQIVSQLLAGPIAESLRAGSASRASGGPIDSAARPAR